MACYRAPGDVKRLVLSDGAEGLKRSMTMIGPHSRCLLHALAARVGVQWYLGAHRSSSWEARRCHAAPSAMPPYTGRVLQQTYGSHAYVVDITLGGWNGTGCPTG